jgi:hypothetical protein
MQGVEEEDWIEPWLLTFQNVSSGFLLLLAFSKCTYAVNFFLTFVHKYLKSSDELGFPF